MKKEKLFDKPVVVNKSPIGEGEQRIYRFSNGYGASIIRIKLDGLEDEIGLIAAFLPIHTFGKDGAYLTYTRNENEWELAVIKFKGEENDDYELCYDTPITNDVIPYLTEEKIEEVLQKIKKLKKGRQNKLNKNNGKRN